MKWLKLYSYLGSGFRKLELIKLSEISKVELCPASNSLNISYSSKTAHLKLDTNPDVVEQLIKAGILDEDFNISQLKLNEGELREKLKEAESRNK
jgi:hypothetical protein